MNQRLARTGIYPLRASPQGFLDQRLPETPVGPGHQNCLTFDCHRFHFCLPSGSCESLLCWLSDWPRQDVAAGRAIWTALTALAVSVVKRLARTSSGRAALVESRPSYARTAPAAVTSAAQPPNGMV